MHGYGDVQTVDGDGIHSWKLTFLRLAMSRTKLGDISLRNQCA